MKATDLKSYKVFVAIANLYPTILTFFSYKLAIVSYEVVKNGQLQGEKGQNSNCKGERKVRIAGEVSHLVFIPWQKNASSLLPCLEI